MEHADMRGAPDAGALAATEPAGSAGPAVPAEGCDPSELTRDVIGRNPRLKGPALALLGIVRERGGLSRDELERLAAAAWSPAFHYTPAVAVDVLVRNRALASRVYVDGEPYEGGLEDVQRDESVPEDAVAEERVELTGEGARLLEEHAADAVLRGLFASHPGYADVYRAVLWAASDEKGCSRMDIEAQVAGMPQLQPDPSSGRTRVYPQYFIDALESAGGIAWDGTWRATAAGRALLEEEGEQP